MTTKSSRLYDAEWQAQNLGPDARWNVAYLHLVGHPITPAAWYQAQALRDQGLSPEEALAS